MPPFGALFSETLADVTENIGGYAKAGVGLFAVVLPVSMILGILAMLGMYFVMIVGGIGSVVAGAAIGEATADQNVGGLIATLGMTGSFALSFVALFGLIALISAALAPISASLMRAIAAHQRGEAPLDFGSAFSTMGQDIGSTCLVMGLSVTASFVGMLFCYVGFLVPAILFGFAPSMVFLHRRGALDAFRRSARFAITKPLEHLVYMIVMFVTSMVAAYVPVIGAIFVMALSVRAYRKIFGDGHEPVTEPAALLT